MSGSIVWGGTGSLQVNGVLTINTDMNWTSGSLTGSGITRIAPGATLTISGTNHYLYDAQQLENAGTVLWIGGDLRLRGTSAITNLAGATFEVQSDASIWDDNGSYAGSGLINAGTFRKTAGTGTTTIYAPILFTNTGKLEVQSGTLFLATGTTSGDLDFIVSATGHFGFSDFYVAGGSSLNVLGGGTLDANGLTFSGTTVVNGSLTLNNSVERMTVEGDLTVNGSFDWRGGYLQGEGTTHIPAETTLTISGTNHYLTMHSNWRMLARCCGSVEI